MKYLMVGDLHGKLEIVEEVLSDNYKEYHKVFLGDYVDAFDRSVDDQLSIIRLLIEAIQTRDDVTALLGNHELSYLKEGMSCSGWNGTTQVQMAHMKQVIFKLFKTHFYITDDILVTHAGATEQLFETKETVEECLRDDDPCLYDIGYQRGGSSHNGGIFWCDYWTEFQEIEGLTQVVGHSARRPGGLYEGIVFEEKCYNIDCLDRINEVLVYDTELKDFEVINLDGH